MLLKNAIRETAGKWRIKFARRLRPLLYCLLASMSASLRIVEIVRVTEPSRVVIG